jgi:hypothetical protein
VLLSYVATEVGSFSAGNLCRNGFPHAFRSCIFVIPGILYVALSVVAQHMFLSLGDRPLFPLLIYSNLTSIGSPSSVVFAYLPPPF